MNLNDRLPTNKFHLLFMILKRFKTFLRFLKKSFVHVRLKRSQRFESRFTPDYRNIQPITLFYNYNNFLSVYWLGNLSVPLTIFGKIWKTQNFVFPSWILFYQRLNYFFEPNFEIIYKIDKNWKNLKI